MVINSNLAAGSSSRRLNVSTGQLSKSLARLSSGSRIVSPEDDAAGLAQSIKLTAQIHRNSAAMDNIANALSFAQTLDGELQSIQKCVDRYSELTMLGMDATKSSEDLQNYNEEGMALFGVLVQYFANPRTFNGVALFDSALDVNVDSEGNTFQMTPINLADVFARGIIASGGTVGSQFLVDEAKAGVELLATARATVGSNIARLQMESETLSVQNENLSAANSLIADLDVAEEATNFARTNILLQSGTSMLAQANALPQSVLKLLG